MSNKSSMQELLAKVKDDVAESIEEDKEQEQIKKEQRELEQKAKVQNEPSTENGKSVSKKLAELGLEKDNSSVDNSVNSLAKKEDNKEVLEKLVTLYKEYYEVNKTNIERSIKNYKAEDIEGLMQYRDDMLNHSFPLSIVHKLVLGDLSDEK